MLRSPPSLIRPIRPLPCRVRAFNIAINRVAPPMISSSQAIALTPDEDRLCTLLDEFKAFVSKTDPDGKQVECRIAGGWVRDKVRRRDSAPSQRGGGSALEISSPSADGPVCSSMGV